MLISKAKIAKFKLTIFIIMVFIDIDGTLLTSSHTITPATKQIIQHIHQNLNIPIILTTARPPQGTFFIYNELALDTPLICFNGGLILNKNHQSEWEYLVNQFVTAHEIEIILQEALQYDINPNLYREQEWYVQNIDDLVHRESRNTKSTPIHTDLLKINSLWKEKHRGANKILLMGTPENINALEKNVNYLLPHLNISKSKPVYLEITHSAASKAQAIKWIADKWNVPQKDVVAIGDNYNDAEMLQWAGTGIAMGNAPMEVKQVADYVTQSNNEEGLRFALEKFFV